MILHPLLLTEGGCAAAGIYSWAACVPSAQLFGHTIRHTGDQKTVALTFDDGPNPAVTPELLDLLDQHSVRATFFVIGKHVRQQPRLTGEIARRGHTVGNHTDSHPALPFLGPQKILEELTRCDQAIIEATGKTPRWMRPPYGFRSPFLNRQVRKRGADGVVMWSRLAADWKPQPTADVARRLHRVQGGDIVLLHDGDHRHTGGARQHTVEALRQWIPQWKESGLRFVTLDQIARMGNS